MSRFDDQGPIPAASLIFGYGAMLPLPLLAIVAWAAPLPWPIVATWLAIWWAAAILIFIGGVRRGMSFTSPGGAKTVELATMLWYFVAGAGSLVARTPLQSLTILLVGYVSVAVLDRRAALAGLAPAYFARLRPIQMLIAGAGLLALIVHRVTWTPPPL